MAAKRDKSRRFLEEHIASRRDLGQYLEVVTKIQREHVARTAEALQQIRNRVEQAMQRRPRV